MVKMNITATYFPKLTGTKWLLNVNFLILKKEKITLKG